MRSCARSWTIICALAELYALIRTAYGDRIYVDREVSNKTRDCFSSTRSRGNLKYQVRYRRLGLKNWRS